MIKEFGVEFYTKGFLDVESDFLEKELGFHLEIRTLYNKLCQVNLKIYVAKESEKIFKFKGSDLVKYGFGSVDFYNQISQKNSVYEIIYRDGKQFFMPEVEND